jgi:hypothetical protein
MADDVYNPRLAALRAQHLRELSDPALRSFAARALIAEGGVKGLANNFEQLSNYAHARGLGVRQALTSGFYGPVNRGAIPSSLAPEHAAAADSAIDSVFAKGRNKIEYRIDQGTKGDPNYAKEQSSQYRPASIDGNFFADHPEVGVGWAQKQAAADEEFRKGGGTIAERQYEEGSAPTTVASTGASTPSGSAGSAAPAAVPAGFGFADQGQAPEQAPEQVASGPEDTFQQLPSQTSFLVRPPMRPRLPLQARNGIGSLFDQSTYGRML